jgi:hypothetical protein
MWTRTPGRVHFFGEAFELGIGQVDQVGATKLACRQGGSRV